MHRSLHSDNCRGFWLVCLTLTLGCGQETTPSEALSAKPPESTALPEAGKNDANGSSEISGDAPQEDTVELKPLSLSGLSGNSPAGGADSTDTSKEQVEKNIQAIISQLQPLQILLGQWRGTTRREFEDFKAVDNHEWVWDLRTNPGSPSLTIHSDKSPYLKEGRLTWDVAAQKFSLTATDVSGAQRTFSGDFTEPVHEIVGSDDKLHRVFRLEFNQVAAATGDNKEQWQLAFVQQENSRYLLEVARRRGTADFARYDTVSTQREGTSFAASDTDYADKTCIISEGLGTTELTYKGRSYWVCCSGCKAAFEEDPEKWIARAAMRDKK